MKVSVHWDTTDDEHPEGQEVGLPEDVNIPQEDINEMNNPEDAIADWLSDKYGWCVYSWAGMTPEKEAI